MKPLPSLVLLAVLTYSAAPLRLPPPRLPKPVPVVEPVPGWIIAGIMRAESGFDPHAVGPDGKDRGILQLRSDYDAERGVVDPFDPIESIGHAQRILVDAYRRLGSWDKAIAAYRQGVEGVRRNGVAWWYVRKVRGR